jgi:O-antigen/teichoic acid export membrane protein
LALAAPIAGAAQGALRIAYPAEYVIPGAPALTILALAMVAFALFVITATILSGMGRPGLAAGIAGVSLVVIILAGTYMVRRAGTGPEALPALATATATGTTLAFLLSAGVLYRRFGVLIPLATLVRGALAACAAGAVAHAFPQDSRILGLAALVAGGLTYLAVLAVTRELTKADVELVTKLRR